MEFVLSPPGFRAWDFSHGVVSNPSSSSVLPCFLFDKHPFLLNYYLYRVRICMRGGYTHANRFILLKYLYCWDYSPLMAFQSFWPYSKWARVHWWDPLYTGHLPCDWKYLDVPQINQTQLYSPTQKLCTFCSFAGPLGVAAIIHFEYRKIKTAIKKNTHTHQMTQFFI